jgi:hypothetical protein
MRGDRVLTYRDDTAVAQIVAFLLTASIGRSESQIHAINRDSRGLLAAVFVCKSLGKILSILLLLEMLDEMVERR